MTFDAPVLLALGLLVVALLVVAVVRTSRRRPRAARGLVGTSVTLMGLLLLSVAAAGPVAAIPVPHAAGTVVLAVDVSSSMAAKDVSPSRLAAAKKAARAFIAAQPATVDIGVVAFEQGALTTAKPNADHSVALAAVNRLKVAGGTSLGAAVLASLSAITGKTVALGTDGTAPDIGTWPSATVVIFSDGENSAGAADADAAATVAENAGVHIDTVGVGTTAGTTVKVDGYSIHTALDEAALKAISSTTGGSYHPASEAAQLNGIASSIDLRLTVSDQKIPIAGAVIALALAALAIGAALTLWRTGRLI